MVTYMHICVLCQRMVWCYKLVETKENTLPSEIEEGPIAIVTFAIFSECISCYLLANLIEACYYDELCVQYQDDVTLLHRWIRGCKSTPVVSVVPLLVLVAESVICEGRSTPYISEVGLFQAIKAS